MGGHTSITTLRIDSHRAGGTEDIDQIRVLERFNAVTAPAWQYQNIACCSYKLVLIVLKPPTLLSRQHDGHLLARMGVWLDDATFFQVYLSHHRLVPEHPSPNQALDRSVGVHLCPAINLRFHRARLPAPLHRPV